MIIKYIKLGYTFYKLHGISRLLILINNRIKKLLFLKIIIYKILKISKLKSKIVFIDVGANNGNAFRFFNKYFYDKRFDYILIEPNKFLKNKLNKLKKKNIKIIHKAAHIKDGNCLFYNFSNKNSNKLESGMIKINHDWHLSLNDKKKGIKIKTFNFLFIEFHAVYIENKTIYKLYRSKENMLKNQLAKSSVITCDW
jgi:FkbM family methyltransferase